MRHHYHHKGTGSFNQKLTLLLLTLCVVKTFAGWSSAQKVMAETQYFAGYYGEKVAIGEEFAVISHTGDRYDVDGINSMTKAGSVTILQTKDGGESWGFYQKICAPERVRYGQFGASVAIDGDNIVVGGYIRVNSNPPKIGDGAAYVFQKNSSGVFTQTQELTTHDTLGGYDGGSFGYSVAIDGKHIAVGALTADGSGAVYMYEKSGETWRLSDKLIDADAEYRDFASRSLALSGDYCAVGASGRDVYDTIRKIDKVNAGAVYIYKKGETGWKKHQFIAPEDCMDYGFLGSSVAINSEYLAMGARHDNARTGSVYIYKLSGENWVKDSKIYASNFRSKDNFGSSLAISGNRVVVGAYSAAIGGSAYLFSKTENGWEESFIYNADGIKRMDEFGQSVAISGNSVIVGSPKADNEVDKAVGAAYIYKYHKINTAPTLTKTYPQTAKENGSIVIKVEMTDAKDSDGDTLTLLLKSGENYTVNGNSVTFKQGFSGELSIGVMVTDGVDTTQSLPLLVDVEPEVSLLTSHPKNKSSLSIKLFPNPTTTNTQFVTIKAPTDISGTFSCKIFDALGNSVFSKRAAFQKGGEFQWDLRSGGVKVATGTYLVVVKVTTQNGSVKLFKSSVGVKR